MAALSKSAHRAAMLIAGCIGLAAFSSCTDDSYPDNRSSNTIGFEITATSENALQSRAATPTEEPSVLLYACNKDSLFLHTTIEDNPSPAESAETRGVPVNKNNFKEICQAFGVKAFVNNKSYTPYMNARVSTEEGGIWTPDGGTRFWPSSETLDFYAYAPYDNAAENMNCTGKQITFSYTVPKSTGSNKDDAKEQPDLMFAFASKSVKDVTDGRVPLNFHHALAAIKFKAHETSSGTIESISIKNVYGSGDCTYDCQAGTDKFTWTQKGERSDFTQSFNVDVDGSNHAVTDKMPETMFMIIPQNLEGAAIEVVFKSKDDGKTYTLQAPLKKENNWEAGKIYTYTISTESINWTYVFEVTPTLTLPLGTTSGNYTVKSYRYRPKAPNNIEKVAWTAVSNKNEDKVNIKSFTYNGEGVINADNTESFPCIFTTLPMETDYPGDKVLKDAKEKGSEDNPYDLSTEGGTQPQTTANCYIVNAPGTYSLPLVYGNAIKNGKDNKEAYNEFKDYQDRDITSPNISGADNCTLVWSDAFHLFKEVKLKGDKLVFTLDKDYMQQANAIVAVRDKDNKIIWSWHIWVTEHDITKTIGLQDTETKELNKYKLMPYNLGWIDGKSVTYKERDIPFTFTQAGSGNVKTLNIKQEGVTLDYKDGGSTYYQWGRKDPIIALKNRKEAGGNDYRPHETWQDGYGYRYEVKQVTLGEAIQHPNVYYISHDGKYENTRWLISPQYNLWDGDFRTSTKTIYDPSPRGFKIPEERAFGVFIKGGYGYDDPKSLNGEIIDDYTYNVYPEEDKKGDPIVLTATGQRVDREVGLGQAGSLWAMDGVYYWCSEGLQSWVGNNENYKEPYNYVGRSLCLRYDAAHKAHTYRADFPGAQTMARPVRCIKE